MLDNFFPDEENRWSDIDMVLHTNVRISPIEHVNNKKILSKVGPTS